MTLLLDTHVILWAANGDSQLSRRALSLIADPANQLVFSAASIWEVVIKDSVGRENFRVNPNILRSRLLENGYEELAITSQHTLAVQNLPTLHKDPFDRLLIAQATVEELTLVTSDEIVASYPGPIVKV